MAVHTSFRLAGASTLSNVRRVLVSVVWSVALLTVNVVVLAQDDAQKIPVKGDAECLSLEDRYSIYQTGGDPGVWLDPCLDESDDAPTAEIPSHGMVLQLFASLPSFGPDLGAMMTWAVVGYLDEASLEYDVKLNSTVDLFNSTDYRPDSVARARVVLQHAVTEKIEEMDANWWWRYRLIFYCFEGNGDAAEESDGGVPITSEAVLLDIKQGLNYYLRQGIETVSVFDFHALSHGVLGLAIEDPRESDTPFVDGPRTMSPTLSPTLQSDPYATTLAPTVGDFFVSGVDPPATRPVREESTYRLPIDTALWDWRRYLGLTIFIGTFVSTIFLTQMAATRQRRRTRKQVWGNLGSQKGVDALLNTGWNIKGTKMEVYDKEGWGYRDDDSMFIGGFEQKDVMGAEVTVTHDSVTTPDTQSSLKSSSQK